MASGGKKVVTDRTQGSSPAPTYVDFEDVFAACEKIRRKNLHGYGYDEPVKHPDGTETVEPWHSSPFVDAKRRLIPTGVGTLLPYYCEWSAKDLRAIGNGERALRTNCVTATLNALAVALAHGQPDGTGSFAPVLGSGARLSKDFFQRWYGVGSVPDSGGASALVAHNVGVEVDGKSVRRGDVVQVDWESGGSHCTYCWDAHRDGDDLLVQLLSSQPSTHGVGVIVSRETLSTHGKMELVKRWGLTPREHPVFAPPRDAGWLETPRARDFYRKHGNWFHVPGKKEDEGTLKVRKIYIGRFHRLFPRFPIALHGSNHVSDSKDGLPAKDGAAAEARTRATSTELYHANNEGDRKNLRKGGFFPIASSRHWHGGVHLYPETDDRVFAPVDGVLVAARLTTDENRSGLGDTGFVLLRTTLEIDSKEATFFTLLYHLRAGGTAAWLDDLLAVPADADPRWTKNLDPKKRWKEVLPVPEAPHRPRGDGDAEDGALRLFEKKSFQSADKGKVVTGQIVEAVETLDGHGWTKLRTQDGAHEGYAFAEGRLAWIDTHRLDPKLKEKRAKLLGGEAVDFFELERKVLIRAGEVVGLAGQVAGDKAIHCQVFSKDMLPFLDKKKADIEDTTDELFTNRQKFEERFFKLFDQTEEGGKGEPPSIQHFMINAATRREDDQLTREEICSFFATSPKRDSMRTIVTRHLSEWGDRIDWKKLDSEPHWAHQSQERKDAFHSDMDKLAWWKSGFAKDAGLPQDQVSHHYNPIAFFAWLDEKRENDQDGSLHASVFEKNHGGVA